MTGEYLAKMEDALEVYPPKNGGMMHRTKQLRIKN